MTLKKEEFEFHNSFIRFLYDEKLSIFVIILSGSLDKDPVIEIKKRIKSLILPLQFNFIVDLSHATYISSTGLGFLMYLLEQRKSFIFLSCPPEIVLKPFKLLEMDDLFSYYYDPEELKIRAAISDEIIQEINKETCTIKEFAYKTRWANILRGYFPTHDDLMKEMKTIMPYILQAEQANSISLPSEEKYATILYKFLDRIFFTIAKISKEEIDDTLVELIAKELMTNAVKHGYDHEKEGVVEANYEIDDEKIEINLIDYGKGFSIPKTSSDYKLSTGLHLLKKIFDNVDIGNAPKKNVQGLVLGKGTMIKMTKYLKPRHLRTH
ncbi:ATP-binding protein [candidate division WOR-3 bacterium]|nr:ATP-binding protein [candidate division WOR-3 bacterium]